MHFLCYDQSFAMGLPCEVAIRLANASDRDRFKELYTELLSDPVSQGMYLPTQKNLDYFMGLFDAFISGEKAGFCLIVDEGACVLWGDVGLSSVFDLRYGNVACGLGTYIHPALRGHGLAKRLWDVAKKVSVAKGFESVIGSVPIGNGSSQRALSKLGVIPTDIQFLIPIREATDVAL